MADKPRYALYTRISKDPAGTSTAPQRQEKECRTLARERGIEIVDVYTDTDLSAYRDVVRPQYEEMLAAMAEGAYDGVLVWKLDRLVRRVVEFSRFWKVASENQVALISKNDTIDTTNPIGLAIVYLIVGLAEQESYNTSLRLKAKEREMAQAGRHKGAGRRAYGLAAGWQEIIPEEAAVIRDLADRLLAGESVRSLALDLNRRRVPSATGGTWSPRAVTSLMRQARLWGWREHNGELTAKGDWPSILDEAMGRKLRELVDSRRGTGGERTVRRHLLSGLLKCGKCGMSMSAASSTDGKRRYKCPAVEHGGCAATTILMERTEEAVIEMALYRLDTPNVAAMLRARSAKKAKTDDVQILAELAEISERTSQLGKAFAAGDLPIAAFSAAQIELDDRTRTLNGRLAAIRQAEPLASIVGGAGGLRSAWDSMSDERRRAVLDAILEGVIVHGHGADWTPETVPAGSILSKSEGPSWFPERLRETLLLEADEAEAEGDMVLAKRRRRQAASRPGGGGWFRPERLEPIWRV